MSERDIQKELNGANEYQPSWPEPFPLPGGLPRVSVLDELLLPESLRPWLVDIAERAQAPLDFPAVGAIVALSSALGRRVQIAPKRHDDWAVTPNLWGLVVGGPGFLKSPMLQEVLKPLAALEALARKENRAAREAYELREQALQVERHRLTKTAGSFNGVVDREQLMNELRELSSERPVERRYIVNDSTVEKLGEILNQNPQGVLLFRDEIIGFLGTMERAGHENDRAFYLEAWNGTGGYTYDRIGRGTLHIQAACISILGAITPGPLAAYLRETFRGNRDDGLIQRFQMSVCPDLPVGWRNVDRSPNTVARQRAVEIFEQLLNLNQRGSVSCSNYQPGDEIPTLHFEQGEAQDFFDVWRSELETRLRDTDEHPVIVAHLAKYRSLMPSLALIFHVCDCLALTNTLPPVTLEAAKRAADWCNYLESHARRIYHGVTGRTDTTVRLLGEKIRAQKLPMSFTAREVYRPQWAGLTEPTDVASALETLESLDWLKTDTMLATTVGGRHSTRYTVNPRIHGMGR